MQRKLVKHGEATHMISLPSKWLKENNLSKGDEITLTESDIGLLVTSSVKNKSIKEITQNTKDLSEKNLENILTHLYRSGFDKIILTDTNQEVLKQLRQIIPKLMGFEITSKSSTEVILENVAEPENTKYDVILKKIFLIISDQIKSTITDLEQSKYNLEEITEDRIQTDKFILFCRRLINKNNIQNSQLEWELLTFLMHIEHTLYYFYEYANKNKIKIEKEIFSLLSELENYFELLRTAYYDKDLNAINRIHDLRKKYQFGIIQEKINSGKNKNNVLYSHLREIFRLIQVGTSPIYGIIFNENSK